MALLANGQAEQLTQAIQEADPGARVYADSEWIYLERGETQWKQLKAIIGERTRKIGKNFEVACSYLERIYSLQLAQK